MKIKRKKEDIRTLILKKVKYYRKSSRILFYDNPKTHYKEKVKLDENELEILLIKLSLSKKILLTTKCLYIIDKNSNTKIHGEDIDRLDYMEYINGESIVKNKSRIKIFFFRLKMNFRIGKYRIVKKDGGFIELKIRRTSFADCLNGSVKKLKFVGSKYIAI